MPLPLCSCGVIPVSASFRRHGASRAATTSFLLLHAAAPPFSVLICCAALEKAPLSLSREKSTLFPDLRPPAALPADSPGNR